MSQFLPLTVGCRLLGLVALWGVACGGGSTSGVDGGTDTSSAVAGGSCMVATSRTCYDYIGSAYNINTGAGCTAIGGVFANGTCPVAARIGSCRRNAGKTTEQIIRFYSPMTLTNAENTCTTAPGIFTAG